MNVAQLFQFGLPPFGFVHVDRVVEVVHQVARYLTERGYLKRDSSGPSRLCMGLVESRIRVGSPNFGLFSREDVKFRGGDNGRSQLGQTAKVIRPTPNVDVNISENENLRSNLLIKEEAAPESYATSIDLLIFQAGISGSRECS